MVYRKKFKACGTGTVFHELDEITFEDKVIGEDIIEDQEIEDTLRLVGLDPSLKICILMGNLFLGILVLFCIVYFDSSKLSILIYPGIPIFSFVIGTKLSSANNLLPGNWLFISRSNIMTNHGYHLTYVLILELLVFTIFSWKILNKRYCNL